MICSKSAKVRQLIRDHSDGNYNNQYQADRMPEPRPASPSSSDGHANAYNNPQPLYNSTPQPSEQYHQSTGYQQHQEQDAYGGYETPNTANPGISPVVYGNSSHARGSSYDNYGQSNYPTSGSHLAPVAPHPQRLNTNLPSNPGFPLTSPSSPVQGDAYPYSTNQQYPATGGAIGGGYDQGHGGEMGGARPPPSYDSLNNMQAGSGELPQPNRRNRGSTDKAGYFQ